MQDEFRSKLNAVARRQKIAQTLRLLGRVLLVSAVASLLVGIGRFAFPEHIPTWLVLGALGIGPVAAIGAAGMRKKDLLAAARAVDVECRLDDRITTAIALDELKSANRFTAMQAQDAAARLGDVAPSRVAPLRAGKTLIVATILAASAATLGMWPIAASSDARADAEQAARSKKERKQLLVERTIRDRESIPLSDQLPFAHRYIIRRYFEPPEPSGDGP